MVIASGKFITLEGGEGVGKTSNLNFVKDWLEAKGVDVLVTREPGGTQIAEKIRELLLAHHDEKMHADAELLLMFAARAQHIQTKILPHINNGGWVLCDRFTDSTWAYQGGGRGIESARISALEAWVQQGFQPDLTLLLDAPIEVGMARARARAELDRFESEKLEFFEKVRQGYLARAAQHKDRFLVVDASQSLEQVQRQIGEQLEGML
jgi:dTMP kinase